VLPRRMLRGAVEEATFQSFLDGVLLQRQTELVETFFVMTMMLVKVLAPTGCGEVIAKEWTMVVVATTHRLIFS